MMRQEIALIVQRELSDPRLAGLPSITRVRVSPDLSVADVYMTSMGTPGQQSATLAALRQSAGAIRTRLTQTMSMRQVPMLKFHIDERLKKELEVLELLQRVSEENQQREREQAGRAEPEPPPEPQDQQQG